MHNCPPSGPLQYSTWPECSQLLHRIYPKPLIHCLRACVLSRCHLLRSSAAYTTRAQCIGLAVAQLLPDSITAYRHSRLINHIVLVSEQLYDALVRTSKNGCCCQPYGGIVVRRKVTYWVAANFVTAFPIAADDGAHIGLVCPAKAAVVPSSACWVLQNKQDTVYDSAHGSPVAQSQLNSTLKLQSFELSGILHLSSQHAGVFCFMHIQLVQWSKACYWMQLAPGRYSGTNA